MDITFSSLIALLLSLVPLSTTADIEGFVPGFRIDVTFAPADCTYKAKAGDYIYQHYTGHLEDGTKFDSSYDRGETFNFKMGMGEVIKGMDMGMKGMCKGERRKITIPHELGYGDQDMDTIPAYSTMIFDVELADIEPSGFKVEVLYMPPGCTRRSTSGDLIREHYNGTLTDGTKFDSSYDRKKTFDFTLGAPGVITGVDMALMDMCEGEMRRITIPSILAYGEGGIKNLIPPSATLMFDVILVEIVEPKLKWYKLNGPECSKQEEAHHEDEVAIMYNGHSESGFELTNGYNTDRTKTISPKSDKLFKFRIGDPGILHGLTHGIVGMCLGQRRRIRIPPELAFGDIDGAGVPQRIRLTLDIEIVDIHKQDLFEAIDSNSDGQISMTEAEEWVRSSPEYDVKLGESREKFDNLMAYYFTHRDADKNGFVSRSEFDIM